MISSHCRGGIHRASPPPADHPPNPLVAAQNPRERKPSAAPRVHNRTQSRNKEKRPKPRRKTVVHPAPGSRNAGAPDRTKLSARRLPKKRARARGPGTKPEKYNAAPMALSGNVKRRGHTRGGEGDRNPVQQSGKGSRAPLRTGPAPEPKQATDLFGEAEEEGNEEEASNPHRPPGWNQPPREGTPQKGRIATASRAASGRRLLPSARHSLSDLPCQGRT